MKKVYIILETEFELDLSNIFDELSSIDFLRGIDEQIMILDEDLLQISLKSGHVVDVGWYPAFERDGNFVINRITNGYWDTPEYQNKVGWNKNELISKIKEAIG